MKKPVKYTKMTKDEYEAIKALLKYLSNVQTAKAVKRSSATIHYIKKSTDFENYHALVKVSTDKQKEKKTTTVVSDIVFANQVPTYVSVPSEDLAKMFNLLAEISEKLDQIIIPKRRLF